MNDGVSVRVVDSGAKIAGLERYLASLAPTAEASERGPQVVPPVTAGAVPEGPTEPTAEELKLDPETVRPFVEIGGNLACRSLGVSELQPGEVEELAKATANVVNKWAPAALLTYQEEFALASVLLAITLVRMPEYAKLKKAEREKKADSDELTDAPEVEEEAA